MHAIISDGKEAMDFKEREEQSVCGGFGGRKGKGKI